MAKSKEQPPQPQDKPAEKPKGSDDTAWGWLLLVGALLWSESNKRGRR